jgi:hypothetical protein
VQRGSCPTDNGRTNVRHSEPELVDDSERFLWIIVTILLTFGGFVMGAAWEQWHLSGCDAFVC